MYSAKMWGIADVGGYFRIWSGITDTKNIIEMFA